MKKVLMGVALFIGISSFAVAQTAPAKTKATTETAKHHSKAHAEKHAKHKAEKKKDGK